MTVSVIIPHYYHQREPNLRLIVDACMSGSVKPCEIIVWANEPLRSPLPGASVITSHRNIGPKARILAAMCVTGDHVLFLDNDVAPHPKTIECLLGSMVGGDMSTLEGRIFDGSPYRKTPKVRGIDVGVRTRVDLSLGRGEMLRRYAAQAAAQRFRLDAEMDDFEFSRAMQESGWGIYVVPCVDRKSFITNLPEYGVGASKDPTFYARRDAEMRWYM